uniref:Uncharacterized protein n=1 Tax=Trichobilharzia regenti TaxID=157069 RepID=A0AA85JNQ3_TRIRE|nr:unnamed protein product [Trichobilharzia regenti]
MDYLSSEVVKRLASNQNAIVYNIPDNEPIKSVQHSLLRAANLLSTPCQCTRLNKNESNLWYSSTSFLTTMCIFLLSILGSQKTLDITSDTLNVQWLQRNVKQPPGESFS